MSNRSSCHRRFAKTIAICRQIDGFTAELMIGNSLIDCAVKLLLSLRLIQRVGPLLTI